MPERAADAAPARAPAMKPAQAVVAAEEREAAVDTGGFQAVFRLPGRVSIAADEGAKSFRIGAATIAPDLLVRAAPALDSTGFLEAGFKHGEDAPLLPGRVAIYRDGIFVGRGQMALTAKEQPVRLGFGADDRVKIERTIVSRTEGSTGIITTSKTDQRDYKTSVRNGHDAAVRVAIEDQLPVSEIDDVKVELLPGSTRADRARREKPARRGGMEFRARPRRSARHQVRLAGALAVRQGDRLRAGSVILGVASPAGAVLVPTGAADWLAGILAGICACQHPVGECPVAEPQGPIGRRGHHHRADRHRNLQGARLQHIRERARP